MNGTLVAGLLLVIGAPVTKERPPVAADLVGEWELQRATTNGKEFQRPPTFTWYTFRADGTLSIRYGDREQTKNAGYSVDAKATPPRFTMVPDRSDRDVVGMTGLFKVEGDTLTLCLAPAKKPPPTGWDDPKALVYVLKRVKKAE